MLGANGAVHGTCQHASSRVCIHTWLHLRGEVGRIGWLGSALRWLGNR